MKKTKLVLGFMLIMLLALSTSLMAQNYSGGSGTSGDPYQIDNKADLQYLSDHSGEWSKHFIQTSDITFTDADFQDGGDFYNGGNGFIPIGNNTTNFTGSYDGGGYTIDNLFVNRSSTDYVGLFGETGAASIIENLGLVNNDIYGFKYVGGIAGYNNNEIDNCYTTGPVNASEDAGGIAGINYGSIKNSHATGAIYAGGNSNSQTAGGLVGDHRGTIDSCYATGNVTCTPDPAPSTYNNAGMEIGGLVGYTYSSEGIYITNSYATGDVTGVEEVGGFVGDNKCDISRCYSTGNVFCNPASDSQYGAEGGGFVGVNYDENIDNCYTFSDVVRVTDGRYNSYGGFVGRLASGSIVNSYCANTVTASTGTPIDGWRAFSGYGMTQNDATTGNFADETVTNQTIVYGAVFKTTDEMKNGDGNNSITDWGWSTVVWERIGYNYPRLKDNPDPTLPVTLSTFTALYTEGATQLSWVTQSEEDNVGWYVYRNTENNFSVAEQINNELIPGNGTTTEPSYYSFADESELTIGQTYYYWLESIDLGGENHIYNTVVNVTIPEPGNDPNLELPTLYEIGTAPNPMQDGTKFKLTMDKTAQVKIEIYNIKGELVKTLPSIIVEADAEQDLYWNGKDRNNCEVGSGLYFYKVKANGKTIENNKLIIMK